MKVYYWFPPLCQMALPVVTAADEALESLKELDSALTANQTLYLEKKREIEEALLAVLSTRKAVLKPALVVTLPTGRPSFPFLEPVENLRRRKARQCLQVGTNGWKHPRNR